MGVYLTPKQCLHCNFSFERPSQAVKGCPNCGKTSGDIVIGSFQLKLIQSILESHDEEIENLANKLYKLDQIHDEKLKQAI